MRRLWVRRTGKLALSGVALLIVAGGALALFLRSAESPSPGSFYTPRPFSPPDPS